MTETTRELLKRGVRQMEREGLEEINERMDHLGRKIVGVEKKNDRLEKSLLVTKRILEKSLLVTKRILEIYIGKEVLDGIYKQMRYEEEIKDQEQAQLEETIEGIENRLEEILNEFNIGNSYTERIYKVWRD